MANYPTSDPSFSDKSPGQKIQSAHIDALQDEVVAIGSALRGTLQHAVTVGTGGLTVSSGGLTVSTGAVTYGQRPTEPPPDAALSFMASIQDLGSSLASTLSFGSLAYAINSSMYAAGQPTRLTPQSTGLYHVSAQVVLAGTPTAASHVFLRVVDSSGGLIGANSVQSSGAMAIQCHGFKRFDVLGGHVSCQVVNNSGGSTLSVQAGQQFTWFSLVKL